jgi:hypothetical protein
MAEKYPGLTIDGKNSPPLRSHGMIVSTDQDEHSDVRQTFLEVSR